MAFPNGSGVGAKVAGLALGFAADRLIGDPRHFHPVAGFGTAASGLEKLTYRDTRAAGVVHTTVLVGAAVASGWAARRGGVLAYALATWTVLGGRTLVRTGNRMAELLEADDIAAARALLPSLCGRDPEFLDAAGLTRAALESIAENTSDAAVAPLYWGAMAGVPGLLAYRAVNTLDAMIGYRNERYRRFGWAAARLDDLANYLPARFAGALTVLLAPAVGGSVSAAMAAWRGDAAKHPSPNAGVVEAATAGALGVRLGGPTTYRHGLELRPTLGSGPTPSVADLRRAVTLSSVVQTAAAVAALALTAAERPVRAGRAA
jgi:adenosylcobinamide-phosphate synthase